MPSSRASARAVKLLPQPGGPCSSTFDRRGTSAFASRSRCCHSRTISLSSDLVLAGTTAQQTAAKAALAAASGWYITLGTGEKVVGGSTTQAGTVFFGTNTPTAVAANACVGNLGEARIYAMNYLTGAPAIDQNYNGILTTSDRYQTRAGGGYPPTPVPISVKIGSRTYQGAISGTTVVTAPTPALGRRYRVFWRRLID